LGGEESEHSLGGGGDDAEYRTLVEWRGDRPELFEHDRAADRVRERVAVLLGQYARPNQAERLVDRAYERAPFEFQRSFRKVRIKLGRTGRYSGLADESASSDLWTLVHDAFEDFPSDRFPQLVEASEAAHQVVNYAWNRLDHRNVRLTAETLEQFWSVFSSFLRVDPLGHSPAVAKHHLDWWETLATRDLLRFQRAIGDIALRVGADDPELKHDGILGPIASGREEERAEGDAAIDLALEDADEIRDLIAGAYRGRVGG
jgi:hypothetical protein